MAQPGLRAGDRRALLAPQTVQADYQVMSYGFRFRTDLTDFGDWIDRLLARFQLEDTGDLPTYSLIRRDNEVVPFALYLDDQLLQEGASLRPLVHHLMWHINSEAIAQTRDLLILHAAAVSWDGRGVLLPAPEDSGKTTLAAALTRTGFAYLTDEAALVDPTTSLLHPYPRALWMDAASLDAIGHKGSSVPSRSLDEPSSLHHVLPEDLRPDPVGEPCPVRSIVVPSYRAGDHTSLEPLGRGTTLIHLLDNAFNFGRFGPRGFQVLAGIVEEADCYRLRMGDLKTAVNLLLDVVGEA
jgi:hypothetical protein